MRKPWGAVFRSGSIGDTLVASSAVAQLAKTHNVEVLCDAPYGSLWENDPHVSKLTEIPTNTIPQSQDEWHKWFRSHAKLYDKFYNLSHSCEALLALQPIQSWFDWPASMRRRHCGHNYLETAHDICEVPHVFDPGPRFYPTDEEKADARRVKRTVGERMIGIVLSGSRFDKVWPMMPQFVAKMLREIKLPVVLFGGPTHDIELSNSVLRTVKQINGNDADLHCCISKDTREQKVEWSMRRNLAQIQECDLVITPDTGLAWGVAMSPMPKIVLLSHASPENITKHWTNTVTLHAEQKRIPCWPCHQLHSETSTCTKAADHNAAACITDIHDSVVMEHVVRLLAHKPKHDAVLWNASVALSVPERGDNGGYPGLLRAE